MARNMDERDPNKNKQPRPPPTLKSSDKPESTDRRIPSQQFPDPLPFHIPPPALHHTQTMTLFGPLGPSLAGYVRSSKSLSRWLKPVSIWYANLAGYRRIGLKYDDLRTSVPSLRSFHAMCR